MDMSSMDMDSMSSGMNMSMNMFFTASLPTQPLWFGSWMPTTAGTTFAACLGLVAIAIFYRLLGAVKNQAAHTWQHRTEGMVSLELAGESNESGSEWVAKRQQGMVVAGVTMPERAVMPFVWAQELPRGLITTVHVGVGYFLMLAVMSYNAFFFVAILVGTFVGEVAFGRF